jgi:hypothetical protein
MAAAEWSVDPWVGRPLAQVAADGPAQEPTPGLDSDRDGVPDREEKPGDSDGDGVEDRLDKDDDGDGIPTREEGRADSDGDGLPDYLDTDSDGDGLSDGNERERDCDGDGVADILDPDSDGDGTPDGSDNHMQCVEGAPVDPVLVLGGELGFLGIGAGRPFYPYGTASLFVDAVLVPQVLVLRAAGGAGLSHLLEPAFSDQRSPRIYALGLASVDLRVHPLPSFRGWSLGVGAGLWFDRRDLRSLGSEAPPVGADPFVQGGVGWTVGLRGGLTLGLDVRVGAAFLFDRPPDGALERSVRLTESISLSLSGSVLRRDRRSASLPRTEPVEVALKPSGARRLGPARGSPSAFRKPPGAAVGKLHALVCPASLWAPGRVLRSVRAPWTGGLMFCVDSSRATASGR